MFIFTENVMEEEFIDDDYMTEADEMITYIIKSKLYPRVEKTLSTTEGGNKFSRLVQEYVNRNSSRLTTIGPMYLVAFGATDKQGFYDCFKIQESEIKDIITEVTEAVNAKASWLLIKNNPIFTLFYCVIRYYTLKKDTKRLNNALIITALAFYPSMFNKYFRFDPNPGVMQYTIDNLSTRFMIKKTNHVFGMLTTSIQGSWKFHEKRIIDGSDQNCIQFIQRIRNDQNSLLKKIAHEYHNNYKKGLSVYTAVDSYDDAIVVDNENDSNRVEKITDKVVLQLTLNGADLKFCDTAAQAGGVSMIDVRNYITMIAVDKYTDDMKRLVESILFIFLYDDKHEFEEIRDMKFISFALQLFKKTNSNNNNIKTMKSILDKFCTDTGIYGKYSRPGTRIGYSKAIYLYFILSIQKYA